MQRNDARLQVLALILFGILACLGIDFGAVHDVMDDVGLVGLDAAPDGNADETVAEDEPTLRGTRVACDGTGQVATPCGAREIAIPLGPTLQAGPDLTPLGTPAGEALRGGLPMITSVFVDRRHGWHTLAEATRDLELDPWQAEAWRRTIQDARRDLDDLRHVPARDGTSWHDRVASVRGAGADFRLAAALADSLMRFHQEELNGGETFGEARRRILDSYRERLRADLTPEQARIFDRHEVDGLIDRVVVARLVHVSKA